MAHYFSFYALSNLLTQTGLHFCRTGQLTSEDAKYTYPVLFIITFVCLSVHTYCILMQINLIYIIFHLYILLFLLSEDGMNMK